MYKEIIKPTLALVVIVGVMSALLAFTYNVAGIGELGNGIPKDELDAMTQTVLPGSTELKSTNVNTENPDVLGVYKDEGGNGSAIFLQSKGYGSEPMKLLVGISSDGKVAGIRVITSTETPGLGTQIEEQNYLEQYKGKNGVLQPKKDGGNIDTVAGATKSSLGLMDGINLALQTYEAVKGDL